MISIEELRKIEPELQELPDAEVEHIRDLLYDQAKLALECFLQDKTGKKHEVHIPSPSDFIFDSMERAAFKRSQEIQAKKEYNERMGQAIRRMRKKIGYYDDKPPKKKE